MALPQRTPAHVTELTELDDDAFIDRRRAVRERKESMPADRVPAALLAEFEAINREFMRRAGMAWRAAGNDGR